MLSWKNIGAFDFKNKLYPRRKLRAVFTYNRLFSLLKFITPINTDTQTARYNIVEYIRLYSIYYINTTGYS